MKPIEIPFNYNYVEAYLTYNCLLNCSYCINKQTELKQVKPMKHQDWIAGLNRLKVRDDLPLTLGGGEPTCYKYFYNVVNNVDKPMDLLTNLQFDVEEFSMKVSSLKFNRTAPYASIRVSFHPEQMKIKKAVKNVKYLKNKGYDIGIWMIEHPRFQQELQAIEIACATHDIDFRVKQLLGKVNGRIYGDMFYKDAVGLLDTKFVFCRPSEILIAPDGKLYRCHRDLYVGENSYGSLLDDDVKIPEEYLSCRVYGRCNPCDIKGPKFNRFQERIHCAVDIIRNKTELDERRAHGEVKVRKIEGYM